MSDTKKIIIDTLKKHIKLRYHLPVTMGVVDEINLKQKISEQTSIDGFDQAADEIIKLLIKPTT